MTTALVRVCRDCSGPVSRQSKTGRCAKCRNVWINNDPECQRRRVEGIRRGLMEHPERKAAARERIRAAGKLPHARKARSEAAKKARFWEKGNAALVGNTEAIARRAKAQSATKLAWCPAELRGEYRRLRRSKKLTAAEAREIILAQHATDMERFRNRIAPPTELPIEAREPVKAPPIELPDNVSPQTHIPAPIELIHAIAREFGFTAADVLGKGRKTALSRCRQTVYTILRAKGNSYPRIAKWLNRDHSSVCYGCDHFNTYARHEPLMLRVFRAYTTENDNAELESEAA